jgi:2-(1,2-epoxy-1,2-dihydrophenyl)acetyl-CoA isomerase
MSASSLADPTREIIAEADKNGVLTVTINRPHRLNALTNQALGELSLVWNKAREADVAAVILTGAGRGFCAGADIRGSSSRLAPGESTQQARGVRFSFNPCVLALSALAKPVVAAINGPVAGAGLGLACASDIRIVSASARFVPAFIKIGLVPDAGTSYFIPRLIGFDKALSWFLSGEAISAEQALEWGLVTEVVPPGDLMDAAAERASSLARWPGFATGATKLLLQRSRQLSLPEMLEMEAEMQSVAAQDPHQLEARRAMEVRLSNES